MSKLQKTIKYNDLVESFSGIRGIFNQGITKELAYKYALNYCQLFKVKTVVIGTDSRKSAPVLKKAMIKAFNDYGVKKIIDLNIVPIQVCEYGIIKLKADGGIYITASHNEPEFNGWKILKKDGALLYPKQIDRLIHQVHISKDLKVSNKQVKTRIVKKQQQAINDYINLVLKQVGKKDLAKIKKANFNILTDPNGSSSVVILERLFKKLKVQSKIVNNKLGQFKRLIEPNEQSLKYLRNKIGKEKFTFACGFDCDADRVELVLTEGSKSVVSGQYVLALACDTYLNNTKNQTVVVNDCTSYLVKAIINKYKAKLKEVEVGEMNVVAEMEKQKSVIGGEGSNGGVIISPIKCRDGIMTMVLILKMLADRQQSLNEIIQSYPKYYSDRIKVICQPKQVIKIKKEIEKYFKNKGYKIKKTGDQSGGLKIMFNQNSYLWFRQSKTEAGTFRIISDGVSKKIVQDILKQGIKLFKKFNK